MKSAIMFNILPMIVSSVSVAGCGSGSHSASYAAQQVAYLWNGISYCYNLPCPMDSRAGQPR